MLAHALTRAQVRAVRTVMRIFTEEDLARGVPVSAQQTCDCCRRFRPAAGFIHYGRTALCNSCATTYEFARLRHTTTSLAEFVGAIRSG